MTYDAIDSAATNGARTNIYHYDDGGSQGVTRQQSTAVHTNECPYPRFFNARSYMNTGFSKNYILRPFLEGPGGSNPVGVHQSSFRVSCYMKWHTWIGADGFIGNSDFFLIGYEEGDGSFQPVIKVASWGDHSSVEKNNIGIWDTGESEGSFSGALLAESGYGSIVEGVWYHMEFSVSGGILTVYQDGNAIVSASCSGGAMAGFGWQRFGFKGYQFREVVFQAGSGHGALPNHKVTANYPISDYGPNEWDVETDGSDPPATSAGTLRQVTTSWLESDTGMELYQIEWCPYIQDILVVSPRVAARSIDSDNPADTGLIKLVSYHVPTETYFLSNPWIVPSLDQRFAGSDGRHFWQAMAANPQTGSPWSADEFYNWRFGFQNTGAIPLRVQEFNVEVLGAASAGYSPNRTKVI
jgi:hypothetical protein